MYLLLIPLVLTLNSCCKWRDCDEESEMQPCYMDTNGDVYESLDDCQSMTPFSPADCTEIDC